MPNNRIFSVFVAAIAAFCAYGESDSGQDPANRIFVSPDGTSDGSTQAAPAALSNDVFLNAAEGTTIVALPGDYTIAETLAFTNENGKAIALEGRSSGDVAATFTGTVAPLLEIRGSTVKGIVFSGVSSSGHIVTSVKGQVLDCTFTNCTVSGKLVFNSNSAGMIVSNCVFSSCTANGVLYDDVNTADSKYMDCVIENCTGTSGGYGGVFRRGKAYRCVVRNYTVKNEEMNIYTTMYDCLIDGVVGKVAREAHTYNCTIINCKGALEHNSNYSHYNDIYFGNKATDKANASPASLLGKFYNCWIEEGVTGGSRSGCLTGSDPKLTATGALRAGSPCIDAGNNSYIGAERTIDLAGNSRIFDDTVDIGCYEKNGYGDGEVFFSMNARPQAAAVGETVELPIQYRADAGDEVTVAIDFGDGSAPTVIVYDAVGGRSAVAATVSHAYAFGGAFTVVASAAFKSGAAPVGQTAPAKYLVQNTVEGNVYVSPAGLDSNTGLSPGEAKRSIVAGVTAVFPGYKVIVKNGSYLQTTEAVIDKAVLVEGESQDGVLLTGGDANRLFTLNHASAVLRKLTITNTVNGLTSAGGIIDVKDGRLEGISIVNCKTGGSLVDVEKTSCTISNCVFRKCTAPTIVDSSVKNIAFDCYDSLFQENSGSSYGGTFRRGNAYRCVFDGCSCSSDAFIYANLYDCLVVNSVNGPKIRETPTYNCTIVGNKSGYVFSGGRNHYNDIIWGNPTQVNDGSLYYCLVDNAASENLKTGCVTEVGELWFDAQYLPHMDSNLYGIGRVYSDETGSTLDTAAFPNASKRGVDLFGNPRLRLKRGVWLDLGCCQRMREGGLIVILR